MARQFDRKLVLENGDVYAGYAFGADIERVCELVYNTAVVGYQEIISDPSYTYQAVVMTYPLIGNYGVTEEDNETNNPQIGALIVREYNDSPSNFRYTKTLGETLEEDKVPGLEGIDTRKLTRFIRDNGSIKGMICNFDRPTEEALEIIKNTEIRKNAVSVVSCKKRWYSRTFNPKYNVIAIDCGIKHSIIRSLNARGCNLTIVPWNTTIEEIENMNPDGILISNGPGDPHEVKEVIELVKKLRGRHPIFGIGLGHLLINLAYGAEVYKMKNGHRGGNYPVKVLENGKVLITGQNHSYAVCAESLEGTGLSVTCKNVVDGSVEGTEAKADRVFSLQYHPDDTAGPEGTVNPFDRFIAMMEEK
ncbi:MAG: glutamine-hydrolyzing carbamoyl-phosphate synthase small subunit [Christensenellaceae bacterium]|nr:glutamine-hydrolyzing carbamoyl-phosphate synthase small subunit [Christensenellaceae bacterium]